MGIFINGVEIKGDKLKNVVYENGLTSVDGVPLGAPGQPPAQRAAAPCEQIRQVAAFERVDASGPFRITWVESHASAMVVADPKTQPFVDIVSDGTTIKARLRPGLAIGERIELRLSSPTLSAVKLAGDVKARFGASDHRDLSIALSGLAQATFNGSASTLDARIEGSSDLRAHFAGSARVRAEGQSSARLVGFGGLDAQAEGGAKIEQSGGLCVAADVRASGASSVKAQFAGQGCSARAEGAARVIYANDGSAVKTRSDGMGRISGTRLSASELAWAEAFSSTLASQRRDAGQSARPPVFDFGARLDKARSAASSARDDEASRRPGRPQPQKR